MLLQVEDKIQMVAAKSKFSTGGFRNIDLILNEFSKLTQFRKTAKEAGK